jgi:hypothetical protein
MIDEKEAEITYVLHFDTGTMGGGGRKKGAI